MLLCHKQLGEDWVGKKEKDKWRAKELFCVLNLNGVHKQPDSVVVLKDAAIYFILFNISKHTNLTLANILKIFIKYSDVW